MAHHSTLLRDPHFQALWMDKGDGQGNAGTTGLGELRGGAAQ